MAEELGMTVNEKEFEAAQEQSKLASKGTFRKDKADTLKLDVHDLAALENNSTIPKTDDSAKFGAFMIIHSIDSCANSKRYRHHQCPGQGHLP